MDLSWSDAEIAFRDEARGWLASNLDAWRAECGGSPRSGDTRAGFAEHLLWEQRLFADRWAAVSWPAAYGGRDASLWEWLLFEEEYYRAGGPQRVTQNGIFLLAPTVFEFGTSDQQDHILPRMASATDLWCQGWSEPNAGSDLAAVRSKARRVDGGWVLDGQKTWTTRGAFCTHLFGLFRTEAASERHRGLSYLLVPLDTPGVTVRGFGRLDGDEGFAEIFFEDAFLAHDALPGGVVLGAVDQGWSVAMAATGSERGLTLRSPGRFMATADRLLDLYRAKGSPAHLRHRVVEAWMRAQAYQLFTLDTVTRLTESGATQAEPTGEASNERGAGSSSSALRAAQQASIQAESSINKIWWSELDVELHEIALDLIGEDLDLDAPWEKGYQFALSGPIYAGTNEIQRNIAAERVLGLPRR